VAVVLSILFRGMEGTSVCDDVVSETASVVEHKEDDDVSSAEGEWE
jgi:hypothetical protein